MQVTHLCVNVRNSMDLDSLDNRSTASLVLRKQEKNTFEKNLK